MAVALTLGACLEAEVALTKIAALPWPVQTAYHMAKLLRLLRAEMQLFEEQRVALIKEFGVARPATAEERARGADGEVVQVAPDKMGDYLRRYQELRAIPVTLAWAPLTLGALNHGTGQAVSGTDLLDLGPLLADEPPTIPPAAA